MFRNARPLCPTCQTATLLARITPGPSGFHIRTFACTTCDYVQQSVADLADPMKSPRTKGWLRGHSIAAVLAQSIS
jgi:hypothetical protein